jgi:hypothetical protein
MAPPIVAELRQPSTVLITAWISYIRTLRTSLPELEKKLADFLELVNMDIFDNDFRELRQNLTDILEKMDSFEVSEERELAVDHGLDSARRDIFLRDIVLDVAKIEQLEERIKAISTTANGRVKQEQFAALQKACIEFLSHARKSYPEEFAVLEAIASSKA